ncbi:MAG: response regulator [Desulfuromonadales bacterium]|nr:response regulator [Desulfuromonadales bacterium]
MTCEILIVDDSPLMLTMLKDILAPTGHTVTAVESGVEACKQIETKHFDLLITDLNMPGIDGIELVRRARQRPEYQAVPIIIMTGENDQKRINEAMNLGISTFLEKPFKGSQLKMMLQLILGA